MMELRPLVIDNDGMVLGGNKRLICLQNLGFEEIPNSWVKSAEDLTEDEKKRFIIADNVGFGEWDHEVLKDWDIDMLTDWGIELESIDDIDYKPNLLPETKYDDVTEQEIKDEAKKLASEMIKNKKKRIACICPECGNEFEIDV